MPRIVKFSYPCASVMHASVLFMMLFFRLGMHAKDDSKYTSDLHNSKNRLHELPLLTVLAAWGNNSTLCNTCTWFSVFWNKLNDIILWVLQFHISILFVLFLHVLCFTHQNVNWSKLEYVCIAYIQQISSLATNCNTTWHECSAQKHYLILLHDLHENILYNNYLVSYIYDVYRNDCKCSCKEFN